MPMRPRHAWSGFRHLFSLGFLGLACAPLATGRAQTIAVNAGSSTVANLAPGGKLTVPVIIDLTNAGATNIASLAAGISWGAGQLAFDSIHVAGAIGWAFSPNTSNAASGSVSFSASNSVALPATATLANAYFTASGTTGGTRVVLAPTSAANSLAQSILLALRPRALDVCIATFVKWGDANGDGSVDIIDAQQIARFSVGLSVANAAALTQRGDVTADGSVDIIDAQQIARYSVGLSAAARINTDLAVVPAATAITVAPNTAQNLAVGMSVQVTATPTAGATDLTGCSGVTWETTDAGVATVNASGFVTGVAAGTATITARSAGNAALFASIGVTSIGGAAQLTFTTQPGGAVSGAAFTTQPVLAIRDVSGNLVTSATNAVTAVISTGTGTLLGTATVNAVAGIATFTNLRIDVAGDKQLTFSATGLTSAVSSTFTVAAALSTAQNVPATAGT